MWWLEAEEGGSWSGEICWFGLGNVFVAGMKNKEINVRVFGECGEDYWR